jgi:hypothetical protein
VTWRATNDPDLIVSPPYFIRRRAGRYVVGRDIGAGNAECLGGFDSADEAKQRVIEIQETVNG